MTSLAVMEDVVEREAEEMAPEALMFVVETSPTMARDAAEMGPVAVMSFAARSPVVVMEPAVREDVTVAVVALTSLVCTIASNFADLATTSSLATNLAEETLVTATIFSEVRDSARDMVAPTYLSESTDFEVKDLDERSPVTCCVTKVASLPSMEPDSLRSVKEEMPLVDCKGPRALSVPSEAKLNCCFPRCVLNSWIR